MSFAALASALSISHHQKSSSSVEKRKVVPAKVRRARKICCTSSSRLAWSGMPFTRRRIDSQSISAAVGQTLGVRLTEPSMRGCARPWRASASMAASLRTSRSGLGDQNLRSMRPSTKAVRPSSIASRAAAGSVKPASCVAATM